MESIDKNLLDKLTAQAKTASRGRINHNFHRSLDEPLHRLLNALEPGTYVRPHRHKNPDKEESFVLLRGKVVFFIFDDQGNILSRHFLSPADGAYGMDIEAGVWHSLVVLESGSVIYETKLGPFAPLSEENMAPWSPPAEDIEAAKAYMEMLMGKAGQK